MMRFTDQVPPDLNAGLQLAQFEPMSLLGAEALNGHILHCATETTANISF